MHYVPMNSSRIDAAEVVVRAVPRIYTLEEPNVPLCGVATTHPT